jgi:hypothetical protein
MGGHHVFTCRLLKFCRFALNPHRAAKPGTSFMDGAACVFGIFVLNLPNSIEHSGWTAGCFQLPAPHLERTPYTAVFAVYYIGVMIVAGTILYRAFQRTVTKTSRRRMIYLLTGATVAAVGYLPLFAVWFRLVCSNPDPVLDHYSALLTCWWVVFWSSWHIQLLFLASPGLIAW